MRKIALVALVLGLGGATLLGQGKSAKEPQIAHMVYFQLKDNSPDKVKEFLAGCDKYLSDHPGTVYYSIGSLAKEFNRDVNDRDWDVALHLVFKTKADHDKYQDSPRHKQFVEQAKASMKKVRVFDAAVMGK